MTRGQAAARTRDRADIVHRPFQINNESDLLFLARLGERLVVTNQDLIGYHNPSYFRNADAWQGYRRITRSALAVADQVVFFSAHARDDALAEDLLEPDRASVVHIGVDHAFVGPRRAGDRPAGAARLPEGAEAILCIGTDFRHKNRVFALRVLEQLQRRHGWQGFLLLAGPTVAQGSSTPEESEMLALRPRVADAVLDFAAVSEAEKAWLYRRVASRALSDGSRGLRTGAVRGGRPRRSVRVGAWDVAKRAAAGRRRADLFPGTTRRARTAHWICCATTDARERNLASIRASAAESDLGCRGREADRALRRDLRCPRHPDERDRAPSTA